MLQFVFDVILNVFSPPFAGKSRLNGLTVNVADAPVCETGMEIGETPEPAISKVVFRTNAEGLEVHEMVTVALFDPEETLDDKYATESVIVQGIFDVMVMVFVPAADVNDRLVGLTDNLGCSPI